MGDAKEALPAFLCPITQAVMRDPVITADGQTYERSAIESWLRDHDTSPSTGARLPNKNLTLNIALRQAIEEWEEAYAMQIRRSDIEIDSRPIGQGSFKTVFKGMLRVAGSPCKLKVAVLKIRNLQSCTTEFKFFLKLGRHPRLVRFMGHCTDGNDQLLLTEFAEFGSLSDVYESIEDQISMAHQRIMLQQICQGMEYLAAEGLLHRDLAARNVLLFAFNGDDARLTSVKVSDFGLSVSSYGRSFAYGDNVQMPIRYMPPEALQRGRFSEKSDVWAFGVTAWEMLSKGLIPYFELTEDRVVIEHVCAGGRLPRGQLPADCPDSLWRIVEGCWAVRAADRPTFAQLLADLGVGVSWEC
jgi:serine/threonine protein kinase